MTDWMPTILNLAQASESVPNDIDGFDQTEAIFGDEPSARKMVVNEFGTNLRRPTTHQGAIQIENGWKLKPDNGLLSSNSGQGSRNRVVVIPVFMSKVTDLVNL